MSRFSPALIVPPTAYPVTLEEVKAQCGYGPDEDAPLLPGYIAAATADVEEKLGLSLMKRTYALEFGTFAEPLELVRGPVTKIVSVEYLDRAGVTQIYPGEPLVRERSFQRWLLSASWPAGSNVTVTYEAGYDELPERFTPLKVAILIKVQLLDDRGADPKVSETLEKAAESLMRPFRRVMV